MSQYLFMTLDAPQPAPIDAPPSPLASSSGLPLPSEGEADTVNSDNASYGSNEDPLPHLDVLGDAQSADISNYVDPAHAPAPPILIAPNFTPPPHTHPLVLRFIHLVRLANGKMGMTEVDINKILQLLMHPELAQAILSEFTNCKELERFELEQLSGLGRGWSVATFNVDGFKPQILFFRDPAQCALWLWDVPGAPWANPYLAIMPDIMHQADLGILHHMISAIRSSHKGSLATFDERLTQIREETRMTNLRFPETAYFESGACVAAHEHRAVLMTRWRRSG
ncbi:hypothetical protein CLOP_g9066 [Closterium sp. NIES-67]|nr:hypothetical protein CLOP_g9066 [Closterium sp. NIES-67]